MTYFMSGVT